MNADGGGQGQPTWARIRRPPGGRGPASVDAPGGVGNIRLHPRRRAYTAGTRGRRDGAQPVS